MSAGGSERSMRRAEREITDRAALDEILKTARILYLALRDEPAPYVIPVCFGVDGGTLYVHSALAGTKIDLLRLHPVVGFSACTEMTVTPGARACDWSSSARSVIGTGRARIVETEAERIRGLDSIMRHYVEESEVRPSYGKGVLSRTCVIAVTIDTLRGKETGRAAPPAARPAPDPPPDAPPPDASATPDY
jgi:nitroimidazol reductase NimA-like FMN-containing flavoprotein (pyridoxamine 5'-phosphate oxidase superfamily)